MKVAIIGLRGFPDIQGGIETHCLNIYPVLAKMGYEPVVFRRKGYVDKKISQTKFENIEFIDLWTPRNKYFENIFHSFRSILEAKKSGVKLLHIHGIGPALLTPLAKFLGMKVVVTHHGRDYNRKKWGKFAKWFLQKGENIGLRYSDAMICVAKEFEETNCNSPFAQKIHYIPNGVVATGSVKDDVILNELGLHEKKYILGVGRLVEEKGFHDLIEAYVKADFNDEMPLVIVGENDFKEAYTRRLIENKPENVIFAGRRDRSALAQLYENAALFVLPSYHEGHPIVLLEAMSHGLPVVVSDIVENRLPELTDKCFYPAGDVEALASKLKAVLAEGVSERISYELQGYSWDKIARATADIYRDVTNS